MEAFAKFQLNCESVFLKVTVHAVDLDRVSVPSPIAIDTVYSQVSLIRGSC